MVSFQYTLCSNERGGYNTIRCAINNPIMCRYVTMTVTSLTSNCNIKVLRSDDFLTFEIGDNRQTCMIKFDDYTQLTPITFAGLINERFGEGNIEALGKYPQASVDNCMRIRFESTEKFSIVNCSYNVKLLLGLYDVAEEKYPIESKFNDGIYELVIESCGYFLSTPILYLVSNLGTPNFRNDSKNGMQSCDVTMRLNNSFTPQIPIIANNGEFSSTVPAGCISGMYFTLVDANMVPVEILNPIYITLTLENADDVMTTYNRQEQYEEKERQKQMLYMLQKQQEEDEKDKMAAREQKITAAMSNAQSLKMAGLEQLNLNPD